MVDQTWISNVKHTKGVKLLNTFCSVHEPQKLLLSPKLSPDQIVYLLLFISFSLHFHRRITWMWMNVTLPHFALSTFFQAKHRPGGTRRTGGSDYNVAPFHSGDKGEAYLNPKLSLHRWLCSPAIMRQSETRYSWSPHGHCYLDINRSGRYYNAGLLSPNWVSSSLLNELLLPPVHSVSRTEAFYTQLQEEQLSRSDPAISFSVASGALTLETGEGSLKSPGQESNLNSCFPGGTLLRLFFFAFHGEIAV